MKCGDLVHVNTWVSELTGIVIDIEPMENCIKASNGVESIYSVTILCDKDVPSWMGTGKICRVTDSILKVINGET